MHRFFVSETHLLVGTETDLAPLAHQLHSVLRLRAGAEIVLLDGSGRGFLVRIDHLAPRAGRGVVLARLEQIGEPRHHLTLYQCSLKATKFEWILQKGTELGISRFVPVISHRSVVRPTSALLKKYERWNRIVREAAEQCGRACLPTLEEPRELADALRDSAQLRLLPWESAPADGTASLAAALVGSKDVCHISLLVGPEGGLREDEVDAAQAQAWRLVTLGPRVLRAETATLAASTLILGHYGELGG